LGILSNILHGLQESLQNVLKTSARLLNASTRLLCSSEGVCWKCWNLPKPYKCLSKIWRFILSFACL
jgi:hypothetical protein